jgi:hypothetical protein
MENITALKEYVAHYAKRIKSAKNRKAISNLAFELALISNDLFIEAI